MFTELCVWDLGDKGGGVLTLDSEKIKEHSKYTPKNRNNIIFKGIKGWPKLSALINLLTTCTCT